MANGPIVIKCNPHKCVVFDCRILRNINKYDCFSVWWNEKKVFTLILFGFAGIFRMVRGKNENFELKFDDIVGKIG